MFEVQGSEFNVENLRYSSMFNVLGCELRLETMVTVTVTTPVSYQKATLFGLETLPPDVAPLPPHVTLSASLVFNLLNLER